MKKIMFNNDKYGLTNAVLQGRKTMTRRIVPSQYVPLIEDGLHGAALIEAQRHGDAFRKNEIVAVAQSYKSIFEESLNYAIPRYHWLDDHIDEKGYANKMFVKASEMPHQIRITDINVERLQDISNEDCLKEGVWIDSHREVLDDNIYTVDVFGKHYCQWHFPSAREAFSFLIDKVSGKGTWERNPYVFCYSFELIK